jgi:hypothetical protein
MDGQDSVTTTIGAESRFHLRPAQVDPGTHKTQLAFGAAVVVLCFLGIFSALLHHPAYLLIAVSAVVVAAIASELGGRSGSRIGGAVGVWAALLFLVSPLQVQNLASPAADAKLVCTTLYLLSVFAYLRFRSTRATPLLRISLVSALASFFVRVEAATLPLTITLAEMLVPLGAAVMLVPLGVTQWSRDAAAPDAAAPDATAPYSTAPGAAARDATAPYSTAPGTAARDATAPNSAAPDIKSLQTTDQSKQGVAVRTQRTPPIVGVMLFWLVLFFTLTAGQLAPHMVPVMDGRAFLTNAPAILHSLNLQPLLLPASLDVAHHAMIAGYALCGAAMVMQSGGAALPIRIVLWLVIFAFVTVANPSLMAAPIALGLSFAALPANGPVSRKFAIIVAVVGALGLALVASSFAAESIHWVQSQKI